MQSESLVVSKIEAGRATLFTQDFDVLEFPADLLPAGVVGSIVRISVQPATDAQVARSKQIDTIVGKLIQDYGVGEADVSAWREEMGREGFIQWGRRGRTAAVISWQRTWNEISRAGRVLLYDVECILVPKAEDCEFFEKKAIHKGVIRKRLYRKAHSNVASSRCGNGIMQHDAALAERRSIQLEHPNLESMFGAYLVFRTSCGLFRTAIIWNSDDLTLTGGKNDPQDAYLVVPDEFEHEPIPSVHLIPLSEATRNCDLIPITAVLVDSAQDSTNAFAVEYNFPAVDRSWFKEQSISP